MSVRELVKLSCGFPHAGDILREAMISQVYADVTLCCIGGEKFHAHRLVLSAASPYLQNVLLAHGRTVGVYEPITMILPDVDGNDLAAVLEFVYTGHTAVSGERLDSFSSTAEALKIDIPPIPRPLTLSCNESPLTTSEMIKCKRYYGEFNAGVNMTKRKLNENKSIGEIPLRILSQNNCLNFDDKYFNASREGLRPRFSVANRVSASPWCQILRPHNLPRLQPIIIRNNIPPGEDIIQTNTESHEKLLTTRELYSSTPDVPLVPVAPVAPVAPVTPADEICSQSTPGYPTNAPEGYQQIITELSREDVSFDEALITPLDKPVPRKLNLLEHNNEKMQPDNTNKNENAHENNNNNNNEKNIAKQHKCSDCDKDFLSRASLKVHARLHSGEKPFRCKDCGKGFSQLRNYKYHRSIHEGTLEFSGTCPECGKTFNDRGYLGSHMKIHRNRKEYSCKECGKSFNQRVAYNMHMRIHSDIKPHQCDQCGKAFSRKMLLKQHLRTHSGERPYQCHICHKAFADRSNMTLHTRLHSGLKPYQCEICSKAFTKKHHLKTHLNYHTGVKPYSCPNCSLAFSQSSNMRTHFKRCSGRDNSVNNHTHDKIYVSNPQVLAFSDAFTPLCSDLEPSSNATSQDTIR